MSIFAFHNYSLTQMKKITLFFLLLGVTCGTAHAAAVSDAADAARGVITRTLGYWPSNLRLIRTEPTVNGCDSYTVQASGGILTIEGTSCVALCKGLHDYLLENGYGVSTWSGSRFELPAEFPDSAPRRVVSPFRDHLYYNVCTFGYTTPFWGWEEWQREIDWMAMHGFDMPLAPIAGEAILARVWRAMGLTDEEIDAYFTGPAHMPWMRMGNMTGLDGAPTPQWHEAQIALQHKILDRMRSLGMKPVCQGFAGFVPAGMQRLYPNLNITRTKWSGFTDHLLSPLDPRFGQIGTAFIRAWEEEFGKCDYYLIDSFNEMDVPFGPHGSPERAETLRNYSRTIYRSVADANPDATWVMQGWMFGYQRDIWDPFSVEALLSGVPDGKLYVIDLAVDFNNFVWRSEKSWNQFSGFDGKEWIYSTVPNFGGRSALTGVLEFYANGHLEALSSPNRGVLRGYGTSPEGVENNDVVYELISAAGWSSAPIDLPRFLHAYSTARYGSSPEGIDRFWSEMTQSAYNEFTNNARHRWQQRPYARRMATMGINSHYYTAIEQFLGVQSLSDNANYRTDAVQYAAFYLAAKADIVLEAIQWAYQTGDLARAARLEKRFTQLLADADRLLASHPILRLDRWSGKARRAGHTPEEQTRFVRESRRLVSTWGGPSLSDYSARIWSGLIRDFYLPRWQHYFEAKRKGAPSDFKTWDEQWHRDTTISAPTPFADPLRAARRLVGAAQEITPELIGRPEHVVSEWSPFEFTDAQIRHSFTISHEQFDRLKGFRIGNMRGTDQVTVEAVYITASRHRWVDLTPGVTVAGGGAPIDIPVRKIEVDAPKAKEFTVYFVLKGRLAADNFASIELLF